MRIYAQLRWNLLSEPLLIPMNATKLSMPLWVMVGVFAASLCMSVGFVIGNPNYSAGEFRTDIAYYMNPMSYLGEDHPFTARSSDRFPTHTPAFVAQDQPDALVEVSKGEYRRVIQAPSATMITSGIFPMAVAISCWLIAMVCAAKAFIRATDRLRLMFAAWRKPSTAAVAPIGTILN